LETLVRQSPNDPALTNDLGVVYLELGNENASYLFRAFTQFEAALRIDSDLSEAAFNLALIYRLLHLTTDEETAIDQLQELETDTYWLAELARDRKAQAMSVYIEENSEEASWKTLLDAALSPPFEAGDLTVSEEIAERFGSQYRDLTPAAMLAPLQDERRNQVVELRGQVQGAIDAYQAQHFDESIRLLDELRPVAKSIGSEFDELWIDFNRAGALIWTANWRDAGPLFAAVAESASRNDFKWLLAETLTVYASYPGLADRPAQVINQLREAIRLYESIGYRSDSVRARIYLAIRMYVEGNDAESLTLASQALSLTDPDDHQQRFQSYLVVTLNPLLRDHPLDFNYNVETARRATLANRPDGLAQANMKLAELSEQNLRQEEADLYISAAEDAALRIGSVLARELVNLNLGLTKAKILTQRGELHSAEEVLMEGLRVLSREQVNDFFYEKYYRLQLANAYDLMGLLEDAHTQFGLAVEAVEKKDSTLDSQTRLSFDEQRREVYEAALAFEFDRGNKDGARTYAQRYRTKLLTEAIDQYATGEQALVERVAAVREGLDNLGDGRVLEYTLLSDRLLMWVRSRNTVEALSYPIERGELQEKVERFLDLMTDLDRGDELNVLAKELHAILINPVIDLLADADSVTIVPDRMLHRLPFAALRSPEDRYLIEDYVLAETLNAPYFLNLPASSPDTGKLVSIGSQEQISSIRIALARMDDIYAGIDSFDGPEVDRTLFLDSMDDAILFHYAGHSALDGTNALSSSILLDGNVDGPNTVTASEIADRRLATNALVILASCDSSVGNSIGGVGFRGLTSAFLIAGAGSVVGSLWPVESTATTQLMLRFHRDLAKGTSIAAALKTAQLSVLAERPHPYFWSGFTVTGNRSALQPAPFLATDFAMAAAEPSL